MTTTPFTRTALTWLAYGLLGYYSYLQNTLGPIMPFLRDELNLNFTVGGLHATAFAAGMVVAGMVGDSFARRTSARTAFWVGGGGMAAGAMLLTLGRVPTVTIGAMFIMGMLGALMLVMIQAVLARIHGENDTIAITEANVAAALFASILPGLVAVLESVSFGWRGALWLPAAGWVLAFLFLRNTPFPPADPDEDLTLSNRPLPPLFWLFWIGMVLGVAVEWIAALWAADFLIEAVNFAPEAAAASLTAFIGASFLSRLVMTRLTRRYRVTNLLMASLVVALVGVLIFWTARFAPLNILGLFITGVGITNAYPLGVAIAIRVAPGQVNRASARASLGPAVSILLAPQILGALADNIGVVQAFGMAAVLMVSALMVIGAASMRWRNMKKV